MKLRDRDKQNKIEYKECINKMKQEINSLSQQNKEYQNNLNKWKINFEISVTKIKQSKIVSFDMINKDKESISEKENAQKQYQNTINLETNTFKQTEIKQNELEKKQNEAERIKNIVIGLQIQENSLSVKQMVFFF